MYYVPEDMGVITLDCIDETNSSFHIGCSAHTFHKGDKKAEIIFIQLNPNCGVCIAFTSIALH